VRSQVEQPARSLSFQHRREVDGLRAIAVLPVILFHAGFESFSGGFVGVDVFFVISGYLITSLIIAEKQAGSFSLIKFYERRARRILPALFVVVFACIPFAWLWLRPSDLASFGKSVTAVFAFSSNVLFWRETGYFDTASDLKPLLHTWSLAVEEQYYLAFPLLLGVIWKFSRRWLIGSVLICALASFALAEWLSIRSPSAAFYLLPARAWEILLGALVALLAPFTGTFLEARRDARWIHSLGILGIALIAYSVVAFDAGTRFPGVYALFPTVGTALVIVFGTRQTIVGRFLSIRPLVAIGLVSYSAYLWHQPLLAFARHRLAHEPAPYTLLTLSALAIMLAFASWRWVEQPVRNKGVVSRRQIFAGALACNAGLMAAGLGLAAQDGHLSRFPATVIGAVEPPKSNGESVCASRKVISAGLSICEFGERNSPVTLAVHGDSHADVLLSVLDTVLRAKHMRGVRIINEACHPIPGIIDSRYERINLHACPDANQRMLDWIRSNATYTVVLIRWTYRLYPVPGAIDRLLFDNGEGGIERGDEPRTNYVAQGNARRSLGAAAKSSAIEKFVTSLADVTDQLVLVYPVPEVGWDVPRYNLAFYLGTGRVPETITTPSAAYSRRNQFITSVLDKFQSAKVQRVKPADLLCDTQLKARCLAAVGGIPLYYDDDHLSNTGAELVVNEIMRSLQFGRAGD
jgi:peptidoglycan/LPS O-acetylase OafA/YrhL